VRRNICAASAKDVMREKADSDLVRRRNRHIVLEALRMHGPMARVELGRLTGLSPASITSISTQLISEKAMLELVESTPRVDHLRRGRPTVQVDLNPQAAHVIAIKISVDGIELALADFDGKISIRKNNVVATYDMHPNMFGRRLVVAIQDLLSSANLEAPQIARIGVAAQGLADSRNGTLAWSPAFKARNIPIAAPIVNEIGVSCSVANDANMIAEGLLARDRYSYTGTAAVVFMGYGVGMGLIINGAVYHGASGAAAEFGHMNHVPGGAMCRCGVAGCLEAYASDYAILRSAEKLSEATPPPFSGVDPEIMLALEKAARAGDADAVLAYEKAGRAIGFGLARMIALLNPDRIVLAGPGMRALDLIEPSLRAAIAEGVVEELRQNVSIETVPIHNDMIIAGTIDAALRHLDSEVFAYGPLPAPLVQDFSKSFL
jgi:predicted NBD/HSP70 family sugar kinase